MPSEVPVGCNLDVESHFDIEQVLVLPKVTCHLTLGVPQVVLQLPNAILRKDTTRTVRPHLLGATEVLGGWILNSHYTLHCPSSCQPKGVMIYGSGWFPASTIPPLTVLRDLDT